jgi:lysylphosphatidylglycerol synthetase-like protein (DUF2156 family)
VQVGRRAGWIVLTISNYDLNFVTGVTHSRNHEIISLFARCYMENRFQVLDVGRAESKRGGAMMRMTIAVAALIVVATTMLRSRSSSIELSTAAKPPLQGLHSMVGVNNLPTEQIEDLSLFR